MDTAKKQLVTIFTALFLFCCIVINWNTVSWMFNYKEVSGLAYDFFNPYPETALFVQAASSTDFNYPGNSSLLIPQIGIYTPVVMAKSIDTQSLEYALDMGAVYYPGSVLPGQDGQIIILGHSAPPNWPYVKHDWVFSRIENLVSGDKLVLKYNGKDYTYIVKEKSIIQKGQNITLSDASVHANILTLVSCWPPGQNYQRIAVTAQLVK